MTDGVKELWDNLEEAFVETDTKTPIHTLLVFRVFQRKIMEGYCRELDMEIEAGRLNEMFDDLADVTEELGEKDAETVKQVADQIKDLMQER